MPERQFDEKSITDAVIARFGGQTSPRARELNSALVRHLHAYLREVEPTMQEWKAAIDALTRTGQMCTATRQEFILLSDVLGVSTLVDAINHRRAGTNMTETTILGPFYVHQTPQRAHGDDLSDGAEGESLTVHITVSDEAGEPVSGALVETWQSDADGYYDVQQGEELTLRGRLRADENGRIWFRSVVPSSYPVPVDGTVGELLRAQDRPPYRPAHVHFRVTAEGFEELITHIFLEGDPYLDSDVVFGVKESLIRQLRRGPDGRATLRYDFILKSRRNER